MSFCTRNAMPTKPRAASAGVRGRRAGKFSLDDAVVELETLDGSGLLHVPGRAQAPPGFFGHRQPQPFLALQRGWLGGQIVQAKTSGRLEGGTA